MPIFSSEDQTRDYISINGIRSRLTLDERYFSYFILKELMDNALDFIDTNSKEFLKIKQNPYVNVTIIEEKDNDLTIIKVRNSNARINDIFTEEQIINIFNPEKFSGSKRHRYKISRGTLGGAFKDILGIPYAFAFKDKKIMDFEDWQYPLQININNERLIKIKFSIVDKIKRKIQADIDTENIKKQDEDNYSLNRFTEIVVHIPRKLDHGIVKWLLNKYVIFNTYVDFSFEIFGNKQQYYEHIQDLNDWQNRQSIDYFSLQNYKELVRSLDPINNDLNTYYEFINSDFKEGSNIAKQKLLEGIHSLSDLQSDDKKIEDNYRLLKYVVWRTSKQENKLEQPKTQPAVIQLPFELKTRREAIRKRLEQVFGVEIINNDINLKE